jgi:hypothetical protein
VFQQRQYNEIQLVEISQTAAVSPGAIVDAAVSHSTAACTLGGTTTPATFGLGDVLEVIPPAGAALNGVEVKAFPTATVGTCNLVFLNNTGGSITPTASTKYTIRAKRLSANVNS